MTPQKLGESSPASSVANVKESGRPADRLCCTVCVLKSLLLKEKSVAFQGQKAFRPESRRLPAVLIEFESDI